MRAPSLSREKYKSWEFDPRNRPFDLDALDRQARAAGFASAYIPPADDPAPLTVRTLLRETFGVFALAVFMAGVAALVGIACLSAERPHGCVAIGGAMQVGCR